MVSSIKVNIYTVVQVLGDPQRQNLGLGGWQVEPSLWLQNDMHDDMKWDLRAKN